VSAEGDEQRIVNRLRDIGLKLGAVHRLSKQGIHLDEANCLVRRCTSMTSCSVATDGGWLGILFAMSVLPKSYRMIAYYLEQHRAAPGQISLGRP
jgi:hypothetical protein